MTSRIQFPEIQGIDELFTESYLNYLTHLHDKFSDQIKILRKERINQLEKAHKNGIEILKLPISEINTKDWVVDEIPNDLKNLLNAFIILINNFIIKWCPHTDSNREPTDYKSVALPIEL